jgi:hypothetical protein
MTPEEELAVRKLRALLNVQPPQLTLLAWLLPLVMALLVGWVVYQIWKMLRDD